MTEDDGQVDVNVTLDLQADQPKQGTTVDELGRFITAAHRREIPGDTAVQVRVGWRGQLQRITIGRP